MISQFETLITFTKHPVPSLGIHRALGVAHGAIAQVAGAQAPPRAVEHLVPCRYHGSTPIAGRFRSWTILRKMDVLGVLAPISPMLGNHHIADVDGI